MPRRVKPPKASSKTPYERILAQDDPMVGYGQENAASGGYGLLPEGSEEKDWTQEMLDLVLIDRELCKICGRKDEEPFMDFVRAAWPIIEPGTQFKEGWHLQAIADHLMAVVRGEIQNLVINIPPRHCKSILISVMFPAWRWTVDPAHRYLCMSYASPLSIRDSVKCRRIVESEWYQERWGADYPYRVRNEQDKKYYDENGVCLVQLLGDQNQKQKYETTAGGSRFATSVGGALTGEGGDTLLCFPYHQKVWTKNGYVPIGEIVENEQQVDVYSVNLKTGQRELKPIENWVKNGESEFVEVHFDDGSTIECTPDHKFWTSEGWKEAQHLLPTDKLPQLPRPDSVDNCAFDPSHIRDLAQSLKTRYVHPLFVVSSNHVGSSYCLTVKDNHNMIMGSGDPVIVSNCDDPHNIIESESKTVREGTVTWWKESASTRINDPKTGAKIIIMQRTHEADISGVMIEEGYDHLVLPARYEHDHPFVSMADVRKKDGDLLWPEHFGEIELKKLEDSLGLYATAGQLQQRPAPREGGMFKKADFKIKHTSEFPEGVLESIRWVRGWDIAASEESDSAWTAGARMAKWGKYFLLFGMARFRLPPGQMENRLHSIVEADGPYLQQTLPQDPGAVGKLVKRYLMEKMAGYAISFSPESGDKVMRASSLAAQCEIGNFVLVNDVSLEEHKKGKIEEWIKIFIEEAIVFPNGRFLDQVDAASRAFHELVGLGIDDDVPPPASSPNLRSHNPESPTYSEADSANVAVNRVLSQHQEKKNELGLAPVTGGL